MQSRTPISRAVASCTVRDYPIGEARPLRQSRPRRVRIHNRHLTLAGEGGRGCLGLSRNDNEVGFGQEGIAVDVGEGHGGGCACAIAVVK